MRTYCTLTNLALAEMTAGHLTLCVLCMGPCTNDMGGGYSRTVFTPSNAFAVAIDAQVVDLAGGAPIATNLLIIYLLNGYV